ITVAAECLVVGFLVSLAATRVVVRPHGASSLTSPAGASVGAAVAVVGMGYSVSRLRVVVDPIGLRICNAMRSWPSTWDEIDEVGLKYVGLRTDVGQRASSWRQGRTPPGLGIRRRDRRYVPA